MISRHFFFQKIKPHSQSRPWFIMAAHGSSSTQGRPNLPFFVGLFCCNVQLNMSKNDWKSFRKPTSIKSTCMQFKEIYKNKASK